MALRTLTFIFSLFLLVACGKGGSGGQGSGTVGAVGMEEISTDLPVPTAALNFNVQLAFDDFSTTQEGKVLEAAELIKQVVASEEFKTAVLKHKWKGKTQFANNNGLSNKAIYKRIVEGSEKLNPGDDNTMNLNLIAYKANNNVVGYTKPSVITVWMNEKFLNKRGSHEVTVNMMHEWLHKLGFGHAFKSTPERRYSVPYGVGYIMGKLAKKFAQA